MIDTDTLKRVKFIEPLHKNGKVQSYQMGWNDAIDAIIENEAEPIKHGHWVGIDDFPHEVWECDRCGNIIEGDRKNYCDNCGAKMDLDEVAE